MSTVSTPMPTDVEPSAAERIERAVIGGDLSPLNETDRVTHYNRVCTETGLNPATRPLAYIVLDGRLQLYCLKAGAEQLRQLHKISIERIERAEEDQNHVVTAYARTGDGRSDVDVGAVSLVEPKERRDPRTGRMEANPLAGQPLSAADAANARKTAVTQAKRRVTLSLAGIGMLDESQIDELVAAGRAFRPGERQERPARQKPTLAIVNTPPSIFADDVPMADGAPPAPAPSEADKKPDMPSSMETPMATHISISDVGQPDTIPVYRPDVMDAAMRILDATNVGPGSLERGPVVGALKKLGANIQRERESGAHVPSAAGDTAATMTAIPAADEQAAHAIIRSLEVWRSNPERLAIAKDSLRSKIAGLPEAARVIVERAHHSLMTQARAAKLAARR